MKTLLSLSFFKMLFLCVQQKKEIHTGFKQLEGCKWWKNYSFKIFINLHDFS